MVSAKMDDVCMGWRAGLTARSVGSCSAHIDRTGIARHTFCSTLLQRSRLPSANTTAWGLAAVGLAGCRANWNTARKAVL